MSHLFDIVGVASELLAELGNPWALVGGLAVSVYVEPRFTRDIDVAVSVHDDHDAEQVVAAFRAGGLDIDTVIEQEAVGRLATVRTYRPGEKEGVVIDLLFASSGIEPEIADEAEKLAIVPGLVVPVARPGHLFALKLLSFDVASRPLDVVDLQNLKAVMDAGEVKAAKRAVRLIEERGFHRGRDLPGLLTSYLEADKN